MLDDPRVKRVLKRYPKHVQFSDASIDLSPYGDAFLLTALRCEDEHGLARPVELDEQAMSYFAQYTEIEFDRSEFDYFLHSYVRTEHHDDYFNDPNIIAYPAPEEVKVPIEPGWRWIAVRPKDGKEHFEGFPVDGNA